MNLRCAGLTGLFLPTCARAIFLKIVHTSLYFIIAQIVILNLFSTLSVAQSHPGIATSPTETITSGPIIVDLHNAPAGRKLAEFLKSYAQGNERSSRVDKLTFNRRTGEVRGKVWVRHRQSWGHGPKCDPDENCTSERSYNCFHTAIEVRKCKETITDPICVARREACKAAGGGGAPIGPYDLTQTADFGFNPRTGAGHFQMDLGRGVKLDTRRIQQLLDGDIRALEAAVPNAGTVTKRFWNKYDDIKSTYQSKYGEQNVYFATKRFVDWAAPDETGGRWVLTAIATGGTAAVAQAMKECKQEAFKEGRDIMAWLQRKGIGEARNVVEQILTGQRVDWPFVAVKWQQVDYFSRNYVLGNPVGPENRVPHAAFVLIWKG